MKTELGCTIPKEKHTQQCLKALSKEAQGDEGLTGRFCHVLSLSFPISTSDQCLHNGATTATTQGYQKSEKKDLRGRVLLTLTEAQRIPVASPCWWVTMWGRAASLF